jgi:hypothetical protein
MRPLFAMLRDELLYLRYSRAPLVLLAVLLAMAFLIGWNANASVRSAYLDYQQQRRTAAEAGQDPDAMLAKPVHTKVSASGDARVTETDNPVRQSFDEVAWALRDVAPSSLVPAALGAMAVLVGPLAFATWGVLFATYDYSNKTVKLRAANGSWPRAVLAKALANAVTVAAVVAAALLVLEVTAPVFDRYVMGTVPGADAYLAHAHTGATSSSVVAQYAVAVFVGVVFSTLGFCGGIIFRRPVVPLAIVVIYNLFVPSLGRYDLKNATAVVIRSVFAFAADLGIISPVPLGRGPAYAILAGLLVVAVAVSAGVAARQSKFVA